MTLYSEGITMGKPIIELEYCTKSRWLARASLISQKILSTLSNEIGGVILIPSKISGIFDICFNRKIIWEREKRGGCQKLKH